MILGDEPAQHTNIFDESLFRCNSIHSFDAKRIRISVLMKQTITSTGTGTNRKFAEEKKALISNRGEFKNREVDINISII